MPGRFHHLQFPVFLLMHIGCFAVFWTSGSVVACIVGLGTYLVQGFGITGFYHRYFSHRSFKTSRWFQFAGAVIGNYACQRGPLWWAAWHRKHHQHSDTEYDAHSPRRQGLLHSHMLWFMLRDNCQTDTAVVPDFARYPELRFLDRHPFLVPASAAGLMFAAGEALRWLAPETGTNGLQMLICGYLIPTMALNHVTYLINSLGHCIGWRRYATRDDSRNSLLLALLTFGEGWHNNHHRFPTAARQGFFWWEVDTTFYLLRLLSWCGLIWDLNAVPESVRHEAVAGGGEQQQAA